MKMNERFGRDRMMKIARAATALIACAIVAAGAATLTADHAQEYVSASPAISFHYNGVRSESMLVDFCWQLRSIRGITGVTYRDYSPADGTVMLTVYYNPRLASPGQVRIFLEQSSLLWTSPRSA